MDLQSVKLCTECLKRALFLKEQDMVFSEFQATLILVGFFLVSAVILAVVYIFSRRKR